MSKDEPEELNGWDVVIELAGQDNTPAQGKAKAMASKKQAFAIANLGRSVFDAQKHISQRLDSLNEQLASASSNSDKLGKRTFWLTIALVFATLVQAIAAIIVARKT